MDISESSAKLASCEVTVEQRVVFKLDLPNRKVIAVKSKYTKILLDVLKPILHKYNYNLEQVKVTLRGGEPVDCSLPVTSVDGMRLNIEQYESNTNIKHPIPPPRTNAPSKTLDEITNKVYEDILQEKAESASSKQKSDKGSVKVSLPSLIILPHRINTIFYRVKIGVQNIPLVYSEDLCEEIRVCTKEKRKV